ncbi:Tyrosine/serine-protein phosphatase IphP-type family protein [Cardinium endosymbiont of Oedothorax gibbosus]|nr:Tyrosine/serine-protein phosphatase IphP-type family protein [Cardinium endosymbiont of Oedothorax gibbosus]
MAVSPQMADKELALSHQEQEDDDDEGYYSDSDNSLKTALPGHEANNVDFAVLIHGLRRIADLKRGIRWDVSGDRLIREVADGKDSLYAAEDYAVQILNIYRAAKRTSDVYGKNGALFASMANRFMDYYGNEVEKSEEFWIQKIKNENTKVVSKLHKIVFPNQDMDAINKKLRLAENYVGLDDTHYNVTTTFTIEGKKFGLEDKKWLTLTERQKQAYLNRKSQKWYKRLDPFEQKLIDAYLNKFLDGNHYIPTQIRNLPGCRNAYQKRILAYDQNNNPTVLGRYYHSGALVSLIQDKDPTISQQITQENWNQILQHAQDQGIEVMSLNHNTDFIVPFLGNFGEKHIVEPVKRIVGAKRFIYLPINHIGTLTRPIFKNQVNKLVQESTNFYQKRYPNLCDAFIKGTKMDRKKQIEQIKDPKDQDYFNRLEQLKEPAENSDIKNTRIHNVDAVTNNYYADIASNYIACKAVLGQATSTAPVLFFCKSGKDRTGCTSSWGDKNIIGMNHSSLAEDKDIEISRQLVQTGHYQFLASVNGGMPGRFGMKPVRVNTITSNFTQQLFPKAARSTAIDLN